MRKIKLMADYQCHPLWEASVGVVGNIDPAELPISLELRDQLVAWAAVFDETLDMDDPLSSGFANDEAAEKFKEEGKILAGRLQSELGASYVVVQ